MTQMALTKYNTGKVILPTQALDYGFPRTGRKNPDGTDERISMPTYANEAAGLYYRGPLEQAKSKLGALPQGIKGALTNKNFWGGDIAKPDDPLVKALGERLWYIFAQGEPIFVSKATQAQGPTEEAATAFGFGKAPNYIYGPKPKGGAAPAYTKTTGTGLRTGLPAGIR